MNRYRVHEAIKVAAQAAGLRVVSVAAAGTTVICYQCGAEQPRNKKKRLVTCAKCGADPEISRPATMDEDRHAARSIARRAAKEVKESGA